MLGAPFVRVHHFSEAPTPTVVPEYNPVLMVPSKCSSKAYPRSKKTVTLILCLLGLFGIAGLHRLYTGKTVSGLAFVFTFGLCFVGTIVDLIAIITNQFKDYRGQLLE